MLSDVAKSAVYIIADTQQRISKGEAMKPLKGITKWVCCLSIVLILSAHTNHAQSMTISGEQATAGHSQHMSPGKLSAPKPVALPHLYWHFLVYVNTLDTVGAKLTAQGKNGAAFSNDLQRRLNFTDTEFAPIRLSAGRLSAELTSLGSQEKAVHSAALPNAEQHEQLKSIHDRRELNISAEINAIQQALPAPRRLALEAFMTEFFAPKDVIYHVPSSIQPSAGKVAQ